jgi:hypothetical protein
MSEAELLSPATPVTTPRIRFDRNELSGAFGDIGTDFPLIVGMILVAKLDAASVLIMFGLMQLLTGFVYGMPMPAQPLKAMAVLVITRKVSGNVLYGGGSTNSPGPSPKAWCAAYNLDWACNYRCWRCRTTFPRMGGEDTH